jgi:hypothetical protein
MKPRCEGREPSRIRNKFARNHDEPSGSRSDSSADNASAQHHAKIHFIEHQVCSINVATVTETNVDGEQLDGTGRNDIGRTNTSRVNNIQKRRSVEVDDRMVDIFGQTIQDLECRSDPRKKTFTDNDASLLCGVYSIIGLGGVIVFILARHGSLNQLHCIISIDCVPARLRSNKANKHMK